MPYHGVDDNNTGNYTIRRQQYRRVKCTPIATTKDNNDHPQLLTLTLTLILSQPKGGILCEA